MGMALSAPQTNTTCKDEEWAKHSLSKLGPILLPLEFKQNEEVLSLLTWVTMSVSHEQTNVRISGVSSIVETYK